MRIYRGGVKGLVGEYVGWVDSVGHIYRGGVKGLVGEYVGRVDSINRRLSLITGTYEDDIFQAGAAALLLLLDEAGDKTQ